MILADAVHPNKTRHELAGRIVNLVLDETDASKNDYEPLANEMPAPVYSHKLERLWK